MHNVGIYRLIMTLSAPRLLLAIDAFLKKNFLIRNLGIICWKEGTLLFLALVNHFTDHTPTSRQQLSPFLSFS